MYIGEPQSVTAMLPSSRNLAKPKSAVRNKPDLGTNSYSYLTTISIFIYAKKNKDRQILSRWQSDVFGFRLC